MRSTTSKTLAPYCSQSIIIRLGSAKVAYRMMLVQILASSACTGVVWRIGAELLEQLRGDLAGALTDAADDARQRRDLGEEARRGDALGHVGDEDLGPDVEAAVLGQVAGDEVGRAGRDRR